MKDCKTDDFAYCSTFPRILAVTHVEEIRRIFVFKMKDSISDYISLPSSRGFAESNSLMKENLPETLSTNGP